MKKVLFFLSSWLILLSGAHSQSVSSITACDSIFVLSKRYTDNVQAVTKVEAGEIVCQQFQYPFYGNHQFDLHSCTKSVLSILIGIAIKQKFIQSENQLVTDFISDKEISNPSEYWRTLTIKHLLTMCSGFLPDESLLRYKSVNIIFSKIKFVAKPGDTFNYNDFDPQLLVKVLEMATKSTIDKFAEKYLFTPLSITNYQWTDFKSEKTGGSGLRLTSADMARIGWLMTDSGKWNKNRLIPFNYWINSITDYKNNSYGYFWWLYPNGDFSANGHDCQYVLCSPQNKTVFVMNSFCSDSTCDSIKTQVVMRVLSKTANRSQQDEFRQNKTSEHAEVVLPEWFAIEANREHTGKSNTGRVALLFKIDKDSNLIVKVTSKKIGLHVLASFKTKLISTSLMRGKLQEHKILLASTYSSSGNTLSFTGEELYLHDVYRGELSFTKTKGTFDLYVNNTLLLQSSFKR